MSFKSIIAICTLFFFTTALATAQNSVKEPLERTAIAKNCEYKTAQEAEKCTIKHLENFFKKNIVYPTAALKEKQAGKVFVKLVFDEKGQLLTTETKITKTPHAILGNEVLRIAKTLPPLLPARLKNGKNVKSTHLIGVDFILPR